MNLFRSFRNIEQGSECTFFVLDLFAFPGSFCLRTQKYIKYRKKNYRNVHENEEDEEINAV
jgi:hypothetical protein